ncbi:G2/mitotic-specific cyclin-1 isoform 1 [Hibiscus syriacus]|uniref:G2/mitotic-specific cyclin-1 isoform 1 n=1 Tax=Hibiscus syriacus TaxID=106335 RepID=A0A6A2XK25_HIBSY|nr:transcription factor MYBC1-like [Hibiscus syriacus]KAE8658819.1 G2/mitotic-specific cyclin-1 isoform 1 [Hibiscus syriacus]
MPLSQSLITPHLALAFDIPNPNHNPRFAQPIPAESTANSGGDELVRTLEQPLLMWNPQPHKRSVDVASHLGIKIIMPLMSVAELTGENIASHLQKHHLYLNRIRGLSGGAKIANF